MGDNDKASYDYRPTDFYAGLNNLHAFATGESYKCLITNDCVHYNHLTLVMDMPKLHSYI